MARAHPETFDYAPKQVLDSIRPGNQVKICDGSERFWVRVTKRDLGGLFVGEIENCLLADTPYGFGDRIRFGVENVYDFSPGTDEEPHEPEQQFFEGFE